MTATYLRDYETLTGNGGAKAPWLAGLRQTALERFQAVGFPGARDEDWRFINLAPLTARSFPLATGGGLLPSAAALAPYLISIPGSRTLVFVNGRFAPSLSSSPEARPGVTVLNLGSALASHADLLDRHLGRYASAEASGFTALNTAFMREGLLVHVARGAEAGGPIHALFVSDGSQEGAASYPRNLIVLEAGATASVIESYVGLGDGSYFTNAVTEGLIGEGARLEHIKIQRESEQAYHVGTTHLRHARDSRGVSHSVSFGAALCRNNLDVVLDGPGVEAQMLGLYMGRGRQEVEENRDSPVGHSRRIGQPEHLLQAHRDDRRSTRVVDRHARAAGDRQVCGRQAAKVLLLLPAQSTAQRRTEVETPQMRPARDPGQIRSQPKLQVGEQGRVRQVRPRLPVEAAQDRDPGL